MYTCPICESSPLKLKFKLDHNIFECNKCKHQCCPEASFNKSFKSDLDEISRLKALKKLRTENFNCIIKSIRRNSTENPKGLEVGPGHGWFLEACKQNGLQCEGIEPETHFNDTYKKNGLIVKNGFYPEALSKDCKYDFIAFNDVFEHLPDIEKIISVNYDYLNPDGLLVINIPIQEGLTYFISKIAYRLGIKSMLNRMWQFNFHSPHLNYFTKYNLISFVRKNRFDLIESFPLKTINLSEIKDRVGEDKSAGFISRYVSIIGVFALYPFMQNFPDTYCFVFKRKE